MRKIQTTKVWVVTLALLAWSGVAFCAEIHDAAKAGAAKKVETLLKTNPELVKNSDDQYGITPLHLAANKQVAELLLASGADINAKDKRGWTPLHWAVYTLRREVSELLLGHKADVNAKDNSGSTALHLAASVDTSKGIIELLLTYKADLSAKDGVGSTPLHVAARWGCEEAVASLLAANADVNAKNNQGETPLACAIEMQRAIDKSETPLGTRHVDPINLRATIDLLRQHAAKESPPKNNP